MAAATFGGVDSVIAVANVGVTIVAATFCGVDKAIVSVSPIVGATVAAAAFGGVGAIIADAFVIATIAAATSGGVAWVIPAPHVCVSVEVDMFCGCKFGG